LWPRNALSGSTPESRNSLIPTRFRQFRPFR